MLFTITWKTAASGAQKPDFRKALTTATDTIKPINKIPVTTPVFIAGTDTTKLPANDTSRLKEKVDTFNLKISKDSLNALH